MRRWASRAQRSRTSSAAVALASRSSTGNASRNICTTVTPAVYSARLYAVAMVGCWTKFITEVPSQSPMITAAAVGSGIRSR